MSRVPRALYGTCPALINVLDSWSVRRHEMVASRGLMEYCHPPMELIAEVFVA